MRKLRVSLTDACNYNCFYCMPNTPTFTPKSFLLKSEEYLDICGSLVAAGIEEIRVTGGEPTVRPKFQEILSALNKLPVRRKAITTNGHLLSKHLMFLKETGWTHLNISLDSLDPGRFHCITGGGDFRTVFAVIEKAKEMGFHVKTNTVVMRGINDDELMDFMAWSAQTGIEVRFLEYMKIGPGLKVQEQRFMKADEILIRLGQEFILKPIRADADSTSLLYTTDCGAKLGLIASESKAFCATCSRLRLSATGILRACVMNSTGISIRHSNPKDLPKIFEKVMDMKPLVHAESNSIPMHTLGG